MLDMIRHPFKRSRRTGKCESNENVGLPYPRR